MKKTLFILALTIGAMSSCKKETADEREGYTEEPVIELVSLNTTTVKQFQDSVIVTIRFKDGNGDLGRQNPDENSLYIKDRRLPNADYYHIPPITPTDVKFKTRGTIRVVVPTLFLLGNGGNETTDIQIKVKDMADNWSNEISTGTITITKD